MKKYIGILSFLIMFSACNPQKKYNHSGKLIDRTRVFDKTPVELYEFPNGLKVAISENSKAPVFSYSLIYSVGSRLEERGKTGLTHILESFMFGEIPEQREGTGFHTYTGQDQTKYVISLPSRYLEDVIKRDAERMQNLNISEQVLEQEKTKILNEKKFLYENDPVWQITNDVKQLAFQKHPYRNPLVGLDNDIKDLNVEKAIGHYKKYYRPNNAIICIAGDVRTNHVLSLIDQYFKISSEEVPVKTLTEEAFQFSERTKTMWLDIKKIQILIAYHVPEASNDNFAYIEFLNTLLSKGEKALFKTRLSDPGIASVSTWYDVSKDPSLYYINLTVLKSGAWKESISIIDDIFDDIKKEGIKEEEMERVLNLSKMANYSQLESNESMISLVENTLNATGKLDDINSKWDKIRKTGSENIQQIVGKYFYKNNRSVVMAFPKK